MGVKPGYCLLHHVINLYILNHAEYGDHPILIKWQVQAELGTGVELDLKTLF